MRLGAAWYLPEERQLTTTEQILDEMAYALGGTSFRRTYFWQRFPQVLLVTLRKITKQAYAMVAFFGMSEKVGNISFYDSSGQSDFGFTKPYSEKTAELIDSEVNDLLLKNLIVRAKEVLKNNMKGLTELAEILLEKEVIFSEDLERIFGKRKGELAKEETAAEVKQLAEAKLADSEKAEKKAKKEKDPEKSGKSKDKPKAESDEADSSKKSLKKSKSKDKEKNSEI